MDELQISGKRYISAKRIARENGYTADYVGQLIRGNKIAGQKVGRAWYVDAASFAAYLGEEGISPMPEVVVAERQPEPAVAIKKEPVVVPVEREEEPTKKIEEEIAEAEPEPAPIVLKIKKEEKKPEELRVSGLRYYQEDAPALPQVRVAAEEQASAFIATEPEGVVSAPGKRSLGRLFGLMTIGVIVFVLSALLATKVSLNLSVEQGNAANAFYSVSW